VVKTSDVEDNAQNV